MVFILIGTVDAQPSETDEVRFFSLKNDQRSISFQTSQDARVMTNAAEEFRDTYTRGSYEEDLELGFTGSIYHPNFMNFNLDTTLGLTQIRNRHLEEKTKDNEIVSNVYLFTNWLQEKPFGFGLYLNKQDTQKKYDFFDNVKINEFSYGCIGHWTNDILPLRVSAEKSRKTEEKELYPSTEDELTVNGSLSNILAEGKINTKLDYRYYTFQRTIPDIYELYGNSHVVDFRNTAQFGKRLDKNRLISALRYMNLKGTRNSENVTFSENFNIGITENLTNSVLYSLNSSRNDIMTIMTHEASVQLQHQLYESLTSGIAIHGNFSRAVNFSENKVGPEASLKYRKNIKIGTLNLLYALQYDFKGRTSSAQLIQINDESLTLRDGIVTYLGNPQGDMDSVVVTDPTGTTEFIKDSDYILQAEGDLVQIIRVPGGNIPNDSEILVDYVAVGSSSYKYTLLKQTGRLQTDFLSDKISVYYQFLTLRYPVVEGTEDLVLDIITNHKVGLMVKLPIVSGSIEYDKHNSTVSPYASLRLGQGVSLSIYRSQLNVQGSESFSWLSGTESPQQFYEVLVHYLLPVSKSLVFNLRCSGHVQKGTQLESSFFSFKSGFNFKRGLLAFTVLYDFELINNPNQERVYNHLFKLGFKREL